MENNITIELLNTYGEKWLNAKIQRMKNLLQIAEPDEALYREIMLSLGYPKNKTQFLELALILPFKELKTIRTREEIEKALLYRAGLIDKANNLPENFDHSLKMDKSVWNFKNIRPVNYPSKRISAISYLLDKTTTEGIVQFFTKMINQEIKPITTPSIAKKSVLNIMNFHQIGTQRKQEMFFNIILPFIMAFLPNDVSKISKFLHEIFETHPPLAENSITKEFRNRVGNASKESTPSTRSYFGIHYFVKTLSIVQGNS
ncbi:MAG: DUF2851 family protein [Bacteroidetes bacterium]|nr:DUF2851 family protein [Bacteroidota bacterium]